MERRLAATVRKSFFLENNYRSNCQGLEPRHRETLQWYRKRALVDAFCPYLLVPNFFKNYWNVIHLKIKINPNQPDPFLEYGVAEQLGSLHFIPVNQECSQTNWKQSITEFGRPILLRKQTVTETQEPMKKKCSGIFWEHIWICKNGHHLCWYLRCTILTILQAELRFSHWRHFLSSWWYIATENSQRFNFIRIHSILKTKR